MRENEPKKPGGPDGHSRRDFLRGSGAAAATAVLTGRRPALEEAEAAQAEPKVLSGTVELTLKVNGQDRPCSVEPRSTLLDTLRHRLDVTGPKRVVYRGSCGPARHRRRRPGLFMHDARCLMPGQDDRDPRELRHGRARRAPCLPPERRSDVRLLHARLRHGVQGLPRQEPRADLSRRSGGARGQHLSMRHVHRRPARRPLAAPKP